MRRIFAAFTIATLFATLPVVAAPTLGECEASDAGNTPSSAAPIEAPAACRGALSMNDADYFQFSVTADQSITLQVTAGSGITDAVVTLVDPAGNSTICSGGRCVELQAADGMWKFGVSTATGPGEYVVALVVAQGASNPSCDEPDAPDSSPGTAVTPPLVCTGEITEEGDQDWFRFSANDGAVIAAALIRQPTPGSGLTSLVLKAPDGSVVPCTNDAASACTVPAAAPGTWSLGITGRTPTTTGAYVVALAMADKVDPIPATCEPQDAGADTATASQREANDVCTGKIADANDVDVYKFGVTATPGNIAAFAISVVPLNGSTYDVTAFSATNTPVGCESLRATVCTSSAAVGGAYYVRVARGTGAPGPYALTIATIVGDPSSVQPAVENLINTALGSATCERNGDAGPDRATAGNVPWTSSTETGALCRGSIIDSDSGSDLVDVFKFRVHTDTATVRVMLQPESPSLDLTLSLTPPPGTCEPAERDANGQCPAIVSTVGRNGTPDFIEKNANGTAKSGDWLITIGRADQAVGGYYELGIHVSSQ